MLSIPKFVDRLRTFGQSSSACRDDKKYSRIEVILDMTMYPNTYGINVRPIHISLCYGNRKKLMNMNDIINTFDGILYLKITETKNRRLTREPTLMIIDTADKTYNDYIYHDYRFSKLFLLDELKQYETIYALAHESMMKYKDEHRSETQYVDDEQGEVIE